MLDIRDEDIGGARIRRTFTKDGVQLKAGDYLTAKQVLEIRLPNRRALSDSNFIEVFPKSSGFVPSSPDDLERFIVAVAKDKFNVIEGRIINKDGVLTRDQAEKLLRE